MSGAQSAPELFSTAGAASFQVSHTADVPPPLTDTQLQCDLMEKSDKQKPLKKLGNLITNLFGKKAGSGPRSPSPLDMLPTYIPASPLSDVSEASDYTLSMVTMPPMRMDSVGWSEAVLAEMLSHLSSDDAEEDPLERSKSALSVSDHDDGTLVNSRCDLQYLSSSGETSPGEPCEPETRVLLDMVELETSLKSAASPEPPTDFLATHMDNLVLEQVASLETIISPVSECSFGCNRFTPGKERGIYLLSHAKLTGALNRIYIHSFDNDVNLPACVMPECTKPGYCVAKTCLLIKKQPTVITGKFSLQEQVRISNLMLHFMDLHRQDWDEVMNNWVPEEVQDADLTMQQVADAEHDRAREKEEHVHSPLDSPVCAHLHHHHLEANDWPDVPKDGRWPVRRTWSDLSADWDDEEELAIRCTRTPSPELETWNVTSPTTAQALQEWKPTICLR